MILSAQNELVRRLRRSGPEGLTAAERKQLDAAIRHNLESDPDSRGVWHFATENAPDVALEVLAKSDIAAVYCPPDSWKALHASRPQETMAVLQQVLRGARGLKLATILNKVGEAGIAEAGDLLYEYTRHRDWDVRGGAMMGLDHLKDPRVVEALGRNAKDLDDGPDPLTAMFDWLKASGHRALQIELIRAAGRNGVHEAEGVLASMVRDAWGGKSLPRVAAGESLATLNRPQALALTKKLLTSWSGTERTVGAMIAEYGELTELWDDVARMSKDDSSKEAREAAGATLHAWSP